MPGLDVLEIDTVDMEACTPGQSGAVVGDNFRSLRVLYAGKGIEGIALTAETRLGLIRTGVPHRVFESPTFRAMIPMPVDDAAPTTTCPARPGDFARILLAGDGAPPRARARDQQADLAGESLRRHVLHRLVALDPDPESLDETLLAIALEQAEPTGPSRGVCSAIRQEWEMARMSPSYWSFLIAQALQADQDEGPSSGKLPEGEARRDDR